VTGLKDKFDEIAQKQPQRPSAVKGDSKRVAMIFKNFNGIVNPRAPFNW